MRNCFKGLGEVQYDHINLRPSIEIPQKVMNSCDERSKNFIPYKVVQDMFTNLNLNSLLVKRQTDNPSPGAVTGGN